MSIPDRAQMLAELNALSSAPGRGALIDATLGMLERTLDTTLVSYNEMEISKGSAEVAIRPFERMHAVAADGVGRYLSEHPIFRWYQHNSGWTPVRMSDTISLSELQQTRLYREDLDPIGARFTVIIPLSPFTVSGKWAYLAANRADEDFSDTELAFVIAAQPAFVTAFRGYLQPAEPDVTITPREKQVLIALAHGYTARRIASDLGLSVSTVTKHLENIYIKLGTSDRLSAVLHAREVGLLREDDLSPEFQWDLHVTLPQRQGEEG